MAKLAELNESIGTDLKPTLVILETFVDLDHESHPSKISRELSTPSPTSQHPEWPLAPEPDNFYSFALLQHISAEVTFKNLSKLVVPIAMTHNRESGVAMRHATTGGAARPRPSSNSFNRLSGSAMSASRESTDPFAPVESGRMLKCLDAGAIDVLTSPLQKDRVYGLAAHAYRAHIEATRDQTAFLATKRLRKRSWVGVDDEKPFAYLRESMYVFRLDALSPDQPRDVIATV